MQGFRMVHLVNMHTWHAMGDGNLFPGVRAYSSQHATNARHHIDGRRQHQSPLFRSNPVLHSSVRVLGLLHDTLHALPMYICISF